MGTRPLTLALAAVLLAALALASLAGAERPPLPGGTVPSTLSLSLGEPSPFARSGPAGPFTSTIRAEVSATDAPVSIALDDEEAIERWSEPVAGAVAKLRLRNRQQTAVVTLMAGGP